MNNAGNMILGPLMHLGPFSLRAPQGLVPPTSEIISPALYPTLNSISKKHSRLSGPTNHFRKTTPLDIARICGSRRRLCKAMMRWLRLLGTNWGHHKLLMLQFSCCSAAKKKTNRQPTPDRSVQGASQSRPSNKSGNWGTPQKSRIFTSCFRSLIGWS